MCHILNLLVRVQVSDAHFAGREAGEQMDQLISQVAVENFFHYDLEDCDQVHIDDVASDDNNQDLRYSKKAAKLEVVFPHEPL